MQTAPGGAEHRREHRSNLFVIATLYAESGSSPVKIRNMSSTGALIEGAVLSPKGSAVRLSRGSLTAAGTVMWLASGRAGLKFDGSITVSDWLPSAHPRQQSIDELVHQSRLGGRPIPSPTPPHPASDWPAGSDELAAELVNIKVSLERVAEDLTSDPVMPARHGISLQLLDVTVQSLARLAAALGSAKS